MVRQAAGAAPARGGTVVSTASFGSKGDLGVATEEGLVARARARARTHRSTHQMSFALDLVRQQRAIRRELPAHRLLPPEAQRRPDGALSPYFRNPPRHAVHDGALAPVLGTRMQTRLLGSGVALRLSFGGLHALGAAHPPHPARPPRVYKGRCVPCRLSRRPVTPGRPVLRILAAHP